MGNPAAPGKAATMRAQYGAWPYPHVPLLASLPSAVPAGIMRMGTRPGCALFTASTMPAHMGASASSRSRQVSFALGLPLSHGHPLGVPVSVQCQGS